MKTAFYCLMILLPALARAGQDPLSGLWPLSQEQAGFELALDQAVFERPLWNAEDPGNRVSTSAYYGLGGMSQKGVDVTLQARWTNGGRNELDFTCPYHFIEFSAFRIGSYVYAPVNPSVYSGDGVGDLQLRHRFLLSCWQKGSLGFLGSLVSAVTAPTGQGEFQASHPLVATGQGSWTGSLGLVLGQKAGPVRLWQEATGTYVVGYAGNIPAGTMLAPRPNGAPDLVYEGGVGWIKPGNCLTLDGGLLATLYEGESSAYCGGLEIRAVFTEETRLGDGNIALTNRKSLDLFPQLKASFAPHFTIQGGARYPMVLVHLPGPSWIEPIFRVEYKF